MLSAFHGKFSDQIRDFVTSWNQNCFEVMTPKVDVFLSYNRSDFAVVSRLGELLRGRGYKIFIDKDQLTPGKPWPEMLEQQIFQASAVAICIGPDGLGPWQKREQYVALDRQSTSPEFSVIPVLLPGAKDPPMGFLRLNTWVDFRDGVEQAMELSLLARAIRRLPSVNRGPAVPDPRASVCPYRGLKSFREEDAPFFRGREVFVASLAEKVTKLPVVAVVGPSGSGKSSVVLAGLVPTLRHRPSMVSRRHVWEVAVMRPGRNPIVQLAALLLPIEGDLDEYDRIKRIKARASDLRSGKVKINDIAQRLIDKQIGTKRILLVIDQFEEIFTTSIDEEARSSIPSHLSAEDRELWLQDCDRQLRNDFVSIISSNFNESQISIVLTLRGDFYGRTLEFRMLNDHLQDAVVNLGPMNLEELRQAVVEPAKLVGLSFQEGVVEEILEQVGTESASLPLLEFLLSELWTRRDSRGLISFDAYLDTGGLRKAITARANRELGELSKEEKEAARRLLIRLVIPGDGNEDSRARIEIPKADRDLSCVISRFVEARLLTTARDEASGREFVEISHEALIRSWETLRAWIDKDREFLQIVNRVRLAKSAWDDEDHHSKASRLLAAGKPIEEAREILNRQDVEISDVKPYINASVRHHRRRQLIRTAAYGTATLAFGTIAGFFWNSKNESLRRKAEAEQIVERRRSEARRRDITGNLTVYSTAYGSFAAEDGDRGFFTKILEGFLFERYVSVLDAVFMAQDQIRQKSASQQIPEIRSSLNGDIFLNPRSETRRFTALCIGWDNYTSMGSLIGAIADAQSISKKLTDLGYKTILFADSSIGEINDYIEKLIDQEKDLCKVSERGLFTRPCDNTAILVYVAGHGFAHEGESYVMTPEFEFVPSEGKSEGFSDSLSLRELRAKLAPYFSTQIFIADISRSELADK